MPTATLNEDDWGTLLERIRDGECTPFLGAGACFGHLPLGGDLAKEWAKEFAYPLDDKEQLPKVAQYVAIRRDRMMPKEKLLRAFKDTVDKCKPDFQDEDEPHAVLADLPLPVYLTTNYDPFMKLALENRNRGCERDYCRWNNFLKQRPSVFDRPDYTPSKERPLVYHLHGYDDLVQSLVLTEDDYLDFLVSYAQDPKLLPGAVLGRVASTSLLFLGYSLLDLDFRTLFRSVELQLRNSIGRSHVSVQLVPVGKNVADEERQQAQEYLGKYFGKLDVHMYWGTCRDFARELRTRWHAFSHGK